jgi:hypothetical protein
MKKLVIGAVVLMMAFGLIGCSNSAGGSDPIYKTVYDFEWGYVDAPGGYLITDIADYDLVAGQPHYTGTTTFYSTEQMSIEEAKDYFILHKDDSTTQTFIYSISVGINSSINFVSTNDNGGLSLYIYYIYWSNPTQIPL